MPVDTSIYQNLLRPKSVQEYSAEMDSAEVNRNALEANRMNLLAAKQAQADEQAVRAAYQRPGFDPQSDQGIADLYRLSPKAGMAAAKARQDALKAAADLGHVNAQTDSQRATAQKTTTEAAGTRLKQYRDTLDFVDTPQGAARWLAAQFQDPLTRDQMSSMGSIEDAIKRIPQDPVGFQQWRQQAALGMEKHMAEMRQQGVADATAKHQANQDRTAAGQLKVAQDRLKYDQDAPKGVQVQSDAGPLMVDPRTGVATPVTLGGKPVGPKLTQVPASAQTAILTNSENVRKVQQAIDLLDGKDVGALKGDKNATGMKSYLPNGALNRVDPKGVDTRAMIADIGSLIVHDRSGAAVTAAETPRLMPFIPLATDDAETARKKLVRFKQVYEQEANALATAYGPDAGYKGRQGGATGNFDAPGDIRSQADAILRGDK